MLDHCRLERANSGRQHGDCCQRHERDSTTSKGPWVALPELLSIFRRCGLGATTAATKDKGANASCSLFFGERVSSGLEAAQRLMKQMEQWELLRVASGAYYRNEYLTSACIPPAHRRESRAGGLCAQFAFAIQQARCSDGTGLRQATAVAADWFTHLPHSANTLFAKARATSAGHTHDCLNRCGLGEGLRHGSAPVQLCGGHKYGQFSRQQSPAHHYLLTAVCHPLQR